MKFEKKENNCKCLFCRIFKILGIMALGIFFYGLIFMCAISVNVVYAVEETEPNNSLEEADAIQLKEDQSISGLMMGNISGDYGQTGDTSKDWFSFQAEAEDRVAITIHTVSGDLDPSISLYNASGGYLKSDSNSGPGNAARISNYKIKSTGVYYIECRGYSTGTYNIDLLVYRDGCIETDENGANNTLNDADELGYTGLIRILGIIDIDDNGGQDQDCFKGHLRAGQTVHLRTLRLVGSSLDPGIKLLDEDGNLYIEDTNSADNGVDAELTYTAIEEGFYYAVVYGESGNCWEAYYVLEWDLQSVVPGAALP